MPEVEVKTIDPKTVMSLSFEGSYAQTTDRLDELMAWMLRVGHPYSDRPFAIYYDDPVEVAEEDLRAEVCLPVEEACEPAEDIERKTVPGGEFVCMMHDGPYSGLDAVYGELFDWLEENDYSFIEDMGTREVFHRISGEVETSDELLTEVQIPIGRSEPVVSDEEETPATQSADEEAQEEVAETPPEAPEATE
jgi:effector-binding domain-containing protein